jgi:hypothetical protein
MQTNNNIHRELNQIDKLVNGKSYSISVNQKMIKFFGDLKIAVFMSQLLYWFGKSKKGFVAKTYEEWEDEIGLSKRELMRICNELRDKGYLLIERKRFRGLVINHYIPLVDKIREDWKNFLLKNQSDKKANLQEVTAESDKSSHSLIYNNTYNDFKKEKEEAKAEVLEPPKIEIQPDPPPIVTESEKVQDFARYYWGRELRAFEIVILENLAKKHGVDKVEQAFQRSALRFKNYVDYIRAVLENPFPPQQFSNTQPKEKKLTAAQRILLKLQQQKQAQEVAE